MKKKLLFVAAIFVATATFAQDGLTSKKGEAFLPEAGDWALGFDGTPFLNYVGNLANGATSNTVKATWVGNTPSMTIYGKYFKDEKTAYRMKLRIGFGSTTIKNSIDTNGTFDSGATIDDEFKTTNFNITLGGGIEKRKGNTRIQGFYGAEALISFGTSSTETDYADVFNDAHTAQWTDFGAGVNPLTGDYNTSIATTRTTETTAGSTFAFGVRGFIGVEWFLAPKVSVAAEYGWGIAISTTGDGDATTERWGPATSTATANSLNTKTVDSTDGGRSFFGIDTDNNGGVISIFFHF